MQFYELEKSFTNENAGIFNALYCEKIILRRAILIDCFGQAFWPLYT